MKSLSALLLVDLQNDFLSDGGAFSKRHIEPNNSVMRLGGWCKPQGNNGDMWHGLLQIMAEQLERLKHSKAKPT